MSDAYKVEQESPGCPHCFSGRSYRIVGPDGVGLSWTCEDADEVALRADELNEAFKSGQGNVANLDNARRALVDQAQEIAELRTALRWCVEHEGECLGDHPARLQEAKDALTGTVSATEETEAILLLRDLVERHLLPAYTDNKVRAFLSRVGCKNQTS